ncbi:hypothetical protein HDU84_005139 [Entophlyctis sp. JEL0112]|nr:hypothetical protein HDU84_005139 [Entophlyctis sp. JEL0112]
MQIGIPGKLQAVIKSLPVVNREVLEYILRFLLKVVSYSSKNLMSVQNLVIVFAPNLFLCPSAPNPPMSPNGNPEKFLVESMQVTKILASIFDHFQEIFEPTEVNNKISSARSTNKLTQQQLPATLSRTKPEDKENQDAMVEKEIKNTISSMLFSSKKPTSEKSNSKSKFPDFNSALFSDLKMKVQQIQKVRETSPSSQEKTETEIFESPEYPQSVSRRPTKLSIDPSKRLGICDESLSLQSGSRTAVYFSDSASVSAINPQSINTLGDASTQSFQEASDEAIPASKRKSVSFSSGISGKASHSYESGLTNLAGPPPPPNKPAPIAPATAKFSAYSVDPEIRTKKPVDKELRSDSGDSKHEGDDELSLNQSVNSAEFGSISDEEDSKLLVQTSLKVTTCPNYETLTPHNLQSSDMPLVQLDRPAFTRIKPIPVVNPAQDTLSISKVHKSSPALDRIDPPSPFASQRRLSYRARSSGSPRSRKSSQTFLTPLQNSLSAGEQSKSESYRTLGSPRTEISPAGVFSGPELSPDKQSPYLGHRKKKGGSKDECSETSESSAANSAGNSLSTLKIAAKSSLERLARKRIRERRPTEIENMTTEQLLEEKAAVKRELAYLKSLFKESTQCSSDDKDILRELYHRYCDLKAHIEARPDHAPVENSQTNNLSKENTVFERCEWFESAYPLTDNERYALLRHEKKTLQILLHNFQNDFMKKNGRKVKTFEDRIPVQAEYARYKEIRDVLEEMESQLKLELNSVDDDDGQ